MATSIKITGVEQTIVEIRGLADQTARRVVAEMSQIAYDKMQEGAGRHTKPPPGGALFQSLYNRPINPLSRQVGHDEKRAPHAKYVLHGTPPHDIRPKNKKALRWVVGNRFVFAKFVKHPGYIGDNYLDRAADDAVRQFGAIVDRAIKGA
jgi:hypothetical protein